MDDIIQIYITMRLDLFFILLVVVAGDTINFPNGYTISSYNTLVSNVAYTINMTFGPLLVPAGSGIVMQFSKNFIINQTTVGPCLYLINGSTYSNATCTTGYNSNNALYEINFQGIYPSNSTQGGINIMLYMMNPMMVGLEYININLINGAQTLAGGLISVVYVASSLMNCSYVSSNDTTGINSTRTISFFPSVPVISDSRLYISLPSWFSSFSINSNAAQGTGASFPCTGISNFDSPPTCSNDITFDTLAYSDQFTISGLIGSTKYLSSPIVFSASGIRNPFSLAPFGPLIFQLKVYDETSGLYVTSQTCSNIYQTVTRMNTPSVTFNINGTLNISTIYASKTARLLIREPFPASTGQFVLTFPLSVQLIYTLTSYPVVTTSTSLTFSGLTLSDLIAGPNVAIAISGLTVITPPSSRPFTITLSTQWTTNGTVYGIDSNFITYFCQTGPLTSVSAVPSVASVNAVTQYILTFTTSNALISGSFVSINFPSELTATVGNCSTNNSAITCSVANTSYASLTISGGISSGSTIKVTFPSVKNPKQVQTTSSFQIFTYYDSGLDSMVDRITTGVTMTSTFNSITTATVTPSSYITYALTTYTFFAVLPDLIPANGYLKLVFPSTVTFGTLAFSSASFPTSNCSISSLNSTITINSCFSADMASANISIVLSGIYNPPSLQPTTSFSLVTYGPVGMVDSITLGLIVTMATPATTNNFSISTLSSTVHTFTQYNLLFTFAVPHQINDYMTLSIPLSMIFLANPACSPISGIISVTCSLINTTSIKITLSAMPSASAQISVSTIRNYDIATSQSFQVFFFNSADYAMETTPLSSVTYTPMTISTVTINSNDQIALYQSSNLTITISTPFEMDSSFLSNQTSLKLTPPATFTISANTTCTPLSGSCSISNGSFLITSVGLSITSFTVSIAKIVLPYFNPTSTSFNIVYSYGGSQVAVTSTGVVVTVYCTTPCERCISTQTACASCMPSPNTAIYLYSVNSSCLNSCPDGYYANNTICVTCNVPCLYCKDSANCTKCTNTTYLYNQACLAVCPPTYFGNSSNICDHCISPCFNCTSLNACTSCFINFYTNSTCVPANNCPAGTFGDIPSLTCAPCSSICLTCNLTSSNCTSCASGFVLYQNDCPTSCPGGYYNNTNACTTCSPPCGNCTSPNTCLTCTSNFLSGGGCVTSDNCPTGTFPNNATMVCATCPVGCSACSSTSNCSGCTSVYFFYNFTCVASCPNTTYLGNSNNCIPCIGCQTCSGSATNCLSCISPQLLSGTSCVSNCSAGTYSNGVSCASCSPTCLTCVNSSTTCLSCNNGLYFSGTSCGSTCSVGTFQDISTNNCTGCDSTCFTCSLSAISCTGCISSKVLYQNTCIPSCPANYFNISGNCQTCPNCNSCTSISLCANCNYGYYMYIGACYLTCPLSAIGDSVTMTCTSCNSPCATCTGTSTNCLSCVGGQYLLNGVCYSSCPSGYTASGGDCTKSLLGNIVYFPFSITFAVFLIIVLYSKFNHSKTETVTALCGILAILVWMSWIVLASQVSNTDKQLQSNARSLILGMCLVGIMVSVVLGFIFAVWLRHEFKTDNGFNEWACHTKSNLNTYRIVFCMTLAAFPCFRILYSRLFNSSSLSIFFLKGGQFLSGSGKFAFIYIATCLFPLLFASGYIIYIKPQYDQTLINSIDSLILDIFLVIMLIIDTHSKDDSFFDQMIENQPYLKKLKYDELNHSLSSLRDGEDNPKAMHRSQVAEKDKQQFFRTKITIIDNLNKFGHLNAPLPEMPGHERKTKTLPDDLEKLPQFDINQDEIRVIDEDFFFQEEQKRRRIQEEERLRLQQQQRKRREQEAEDERQRKRRLADDDMDEQHQIQFPDLAAIQKVERKGENMKKSPTHILNNFKKVEDRNISEKDRKKVEEVAKKNGLDPTFMSQTFGVEKHHNPQLLSSIIDIHNHVDRQAVKGLFATSNNPEVLQQLFSKKSTMDPDRLRNILNDPESAQMIKKLADAQGGIISPDVAKLLFDTNSKFSEEFVKELLLAGKGQTLDPEKIKQMLRDCPDKASREAALKALKKLGGSNLENKALLENLLGVQSLLEAQHFTRVANDLSKKAVEHLFREKSERNNTIITKLLNNKKIDLKNLSIIFQDPELLDELAKALSTGNKDLEENLLNLFKNGEQLDPQLLKDFLTRPNLLQKLASKPIDPAFLTSLLKKDAKTDLNLLQKAIEEMSPEQIGKVFQFNPQKNVDFERVARLFEYNSKTDPSLIAELLTPEVVESVYNKASGARPQMLNKLVEKGKQVDPEAILKIYGDDKRSFRENGRVGEVGGAMMMDIDNIEGGIMNKELNRKYNNTDNNFNLVNEDFQDELGYKKGQNEVNMSRTDGRMLGFLSPIQVGQHRSKKYKNGLDPIQGRGRNNANVNDIDDIDDQQITEYNDGQGGKAEDDDEYEIVEEGGKRRRRKKIKKKPLDDIRLPSEHIYLQRLEAPHELKKKNIRKKKKKGSSSMQQLEPMDQDNEVYDLDF